MKEILLKKGLSIYQCAKKSGLPYTTVSDIVKRKTSLSKVSAITLYKLSKTFDMTMEELLETELTKEDDLSSWENFKSTIQHQLKEKGDKQFIIDVVQEDTPVHYWENARYRECLYLVAMLDYLCRIHGLDAYSGYDTYRSYKLNKLLLPQDVRLAEELGIDIEKDAMEHAIPEFLKFNILEGDIRNVC